MGTSIIKVAIALLISSVVSAVALKEAKKTDALLDKNNFVIHQPKALLMVYIIVTVLFSLMYVFVIIGEIDSGTIERWWINLLGMSPFLLLGPFLIILWRRWKITVKGNRITASSYFGRKKAFTFDYITKVKHGTLQGKWPSIEYIKAYHEKKRLFSVTAVCPGFQVLYTRLREEGVHVEDIRKPFAGFF